MHNMHAVVLSVSPGDSQDLIPFSLKESEFGWESLTRSLSASHFFKDTATPHLEFNLQYNIGGSNDDAAMVDSSVDG